MKKLFSIVIALTFANNIQSQSKNKLPLDPERLIKIETNEGTWMSLDVHPDGDKIIFDLLGDLYELP